MKTLDPSRRSHLGAIVLVAMGVALSEPTIVAAAPAETTPGVAIQAQRVNVNLSCQTGGAYAFNATLNDAAANRTYPAEYQVHALGGGGGDFDWKGMGNVYTGSFGIGSTNTISFPSGGGDGVSVQVRINGSIGYAEDTC